MNIGPTIAFVIPVAIIFAADRLVRQLFGTTRYLPTYQAYPKRGRLEEEPARFRGSIGQLLDLGQPKIRETSNA